MRKSRKEYQREYRLSHPTKSAEYTKRWRDKNKGKARQASRERARAQVIKIKDEMIAAYGGKCSCCDENRREFMSLDHMKKGEGKEHREKFKTSLRILKYLKSLGWPKDNYRLLCFNCNMSYGIWGYCPHNLVEDTEERWEALRRGHVSKP